MDIFQAQRAQVAELSVGAGEFGDVEAQGVTVNHFPTLHDEVASSLPIEAADDTAGPERANILASFENIYVSPVQEADFARPSWE